MMITTSATNLTPLTVSSNNIYSSNDTITIKNTSANVSWDIVSNIRENSIERLVDDVDDLRAEYVRTRMELEDLKSVIKSLTESYSRLSDDYEELRESVGKTDSIFLPSNSPNLTTEHLAEFFGNET